MTLDLFAPEPRQNILPYDGDVQDYGCIFSPDEADAYFQYLLQHLHWRHDEAKRMESTLLPQDRWRGMAIDTIATATRA